MGGGGFRLFSGSGLAGGPLWSAAGSGGQRIHPGTVHHLLVLGHRSRRLLSGLRRGRVIFSFIIAGSTAEILIYSVFFGFGVGGLLSVSAVAYAGYYGRRSLGVMRGVTDPLTSFAQAIGAVVSGVIFDLTESYLLAFIAFAVLGGAATVLVLFARPSLRATAAAV